MRRYTGRFMRSPGSFHWRREAWLALALMLGGAGCNEDPMQMVAPDLGGEPVEINQKPTGSISTPSLCERLGVDTRVTTTGAGSFSFVWVDDHYQVVFSDLAQEDIFSVKVDRQGKLLGAVELVEATPGPSTLPTILRVANGFVVAWQDDVNVRLHKLDADGHPSGTGKVVATGRSTQTRPVLSASPMGTVLAWMDQTLDSSMNNDEIGDSRGSIALVADDLSLRTDVPTKPFSPSANAGYPWLAGDAQRLAILWSETDRGRTDTFYSTVTDQLALPSKIGTRDAGAANAALLGRLMLTDFGALASWEDHRGGQAEIYMSLLDPTGFVYAGGLVEEPDTGNANWSHMAWTGSAAGVVYYQFRSGKPQIFMTFIDNRGVRIGGAADMQLSNTTGWARFPDLLWNGDEFGGMWIDGRGGQTELYFNRAACKKPLPI